MIFRRYAGFSHYDGLYCYEFRSIGLFGRTKYWTLHERDPIESWNDWFEPA